jgi:hypothetical protein
MGCVECEIIDCLCDSPVQGLAQRDSIAPSCDKETEQYKNRSPWVGVHGVS